MIAVGLGLLGCRAPADPLSCVGEGCAFSQGEWARLTALAWVQLGTPRADSTNAVAANPAAVALGKRFFCDARFSGPATQVDALRRPAAVASAPVGQPTNLSCASCHDLARGGVDTRSVPGNVSSGAGWSDVNALGIVNCAYQRLYTWNGRADSLWAQAFAVAENPTTMNGNRLHTVQVIFEDYAAEYTRLFGRIRIRVLQLPPNGKPGNAGCDPSDPSEPFGDAFDCLPAGDQDTVTRVLVNWAKALAAYEATLVSGETPFDRFVGEGPASDAISPAAKRGARLFVGKAGCIDCHDTALFSDRDFHNVGVPQAGPAVPTVADCPSGKKVCDCVAGNGCLPWGAYDGLKKLQAPKNTMRRNSMWSDDPSDTSRAADVARTPTEALEGAWRTPSLRDVALTAPYMHDGVYTTLEEVVAHYSRGPDPGAVGTPAVDIKPLLLTEDEQVDLVAFLQTLSAEVVTSAVDGGADGSARMGPPGMCPVDGGAVDGGVAACSGLPPTSPFITVATGFLLADEVAGAPYTFAAPNLVPPAAARLDPLPANVAPGLLVRADPGTPSDPDNAFVGFGIGFTNPPCVDARAFTGLRFTIDGDLGTCGLQFSAVPSADNSVANGQFGGCTAGSACVPPLSGPIHTGTTTVCFADMSGGFPVATVDPAALNGVQWTLTAPTAAGVPPCSATLSVHDVAFTRDPACD